MQVFNTVMQPRGIHLAYEQQDKASGAPILGLVPELLLIPVSFVFYFQNKRCIRLQV